MMQPPLESALRPRLAPVFPDVQPEPVVEGLEKSPLTSFFFRTRRDRVNRLDPHRHANAALQ